MWGKQSRRNWRRIAAIQSERRGIHDQIEMCDLESNSRLFPRNRLQSRDRTQDLGTGKIFSQFLSQLLRRSESAVGNDETLAIFPSTLQGDRPSCATTAQDHHLQIAKIDRELLPNGTGESFAIGVIAAKFCVIDLDRIDCADAARVAINFVHQFGGSDFVWRGQVHSDEVQVTN